MRTGYSCYMLDPYRVAETMGESARYLELTPATGELQAAQDLKNNLLDPKGIRPILTILLLPDGTFFDTGAEPVSWRDGLRLVDLLKPETLRAVGVAGDDGEDALVDRARTQIESISAELKERSVGLAYENHGEKASTVRRIVEAFDRDLVGVLLDPSNGYLSGEDPLSVMDELMPLTRYMHVKDVPLNPDGSLAAPSCPLGEGNANWAAYARRIRAAGGDYLFVFELPGYKGGVFDGYRRSLEVLRELLAE